MRTVQVTIKQIADAIRKNGVPQIEGEFLVLDMAGKLVGGCAIGQGAYNLRVDPGAMNDVLKMYGISVFDLNDSQHMSLDEIAKFIENRVTNLDEVVELPLMPRTHQIANASTYSPEYFDDILINKP